MNDFGLKLSSRDGRQGVHVKYFLGTVPISALNRIEMAFFRWAILTVLRHEISQQAAYTQRDR